MAMGAKPLRDLVDLVGIEPTTSSMPLMKSIEISTGSKTWANPLKTCDGLFSFS